MARIINDDYKYKINGRKAPRITIDELKAQIKKTAMKHNGGAYREDDEGVTYDEYAFVIIHEDPTVNADQKYHIYFENFFGEDSAFCDTFSGFHTLDNGLTYYGFNGGADGDMDTFGILYYDGKKIRLYFPTYGNSINAKYKCALFNEGEYEIKGKIYDVTEDDPAGEYCAKYGLDPTEEVINIEAMKKEISEHIEVI